jgi:xylan 1,4-beta-xylosidase
MQRQKIQLIFIGTLALANTSAQQVQETTKQTPAKPASTFFDQYAPGNSLAPSQVKDFHTIYPYSGVSGPGFPVVGEGLGGWRSGTAGVTYQGLHPKPYFKVVTSGLTTRSAVTTGLLPPIKPLMEAQVRDTIITLGGDGNYYMTGSTGENIWAFNDGVELWRSSDLKQWSYMGLVWSLDRDASWEKQTRLMHDKPVRAIWAPEIHYIRHNYYICLSMAPGGIALLKSSTGKPEGPYINALASDEPLATGIDATLFEDDDGKVYFTNGSASHIVRLKDDLSGLAEAWHDIKLEDPDHNPTHHAAKCVERGSNDIGHEGAVLFKANGIYYLGAADSYEGRYSTMLAMSKSIYGPYHSRHESVPTGGGTGFFKDKQDRWWTTYFGNDEQAAWREKPGIVRVDFAADGEVVVSRHQPFVNDPTWK